MLKFVYKLVNLTQSYCRKHKGLFFGHTVDLSLRNKLCMINLIEIRSRCGNRAP